MTVKISLPPSATWAGSVNQSVGRQTIGSLGSSSEDSTNGSLKKPNFNERHPKVVRSLTVFAYIVCVSLAAIILSAYYVVLWTPKPINEYKHIPVNTTNLPCRGGGVTVYSEGSTEDAPVYYHRPSRYSSRHGRPRVSKLVSRRGSRTKSPHKIIDSDLSLQRDAPVVKEGNHTSSNNSGKATPLEDHNHDQQQPNDYSFEEEEEEHASGMEKTATSFVPNSSASPETASPTTTQTPPDSIILRKLLEGLGRPTTTEEPR